MTSPDRGDEPGGPVIRDRRRIDPETGAVREPAETQAPGAAPGGGGAQQPGPAGGTPAGAPAGGQPGAPAGAQPGGPSGEPAGAGGGASDEVAALKAQLAERTADLQRLQAEYVNYRRRVDRDKATLREHAVGSALNELLPILDDIGRAREHGELTGGFKSVAESLEATTGKLGLERYGEAGEPFDPTVHEALMHSYSPDVTETSVVNVLQPGYRIGDRILRAARVAVAEPEAGGDTATAADTEQ
ncbi:nucleotide exchange factor GrpE [Actinomadura flavalba]|uniref:nucleotide exchange factor GrpE n=1 Tax=Actinomadura flavalba TaxID=1120938 RepID=UPI0003702559|nr:nucleotide exchange factor GrpE [Actinomadura flavalba]